MMGHTSPIMLRVLKRATENYRIKNYILKDLEVLLSIKLKNGWLYRARFIKIQHLKYIVVLAYRSEKRYRSGRPNYTLTEGIDP